MLEKMLSIREDFHFDPFCIIEVWNRLLANFFTDGFDIAHLQSFKGKVNKHGCLREAWARRGVRSRVTSTRW